MSFGYSTSDTIDLDGTAAGEISLFLGMGGDDLSLDAPPNGMGAPISTAEFSIFNAGGMGDPNYLISYNPGDTVDSSLNYTAEGFLSKGGVIYSDWTPGDFGYAGFLFNPASGPTPLYGWARIEFAGSGKDFTVTEWAYDDLGDPITVGANPEPSTALLLGLGLAALAASVKRRGPRAGASQAG